MDQYTSSMQNWMNGGTGSGNDPNRPNQNPPQTNAQVCADVKPRLTKEQHDILEAHFQQQHKPSTSTKRQFAEALGVPLDKINNWFQNRRAKVKQDAKKQLNALQMFHSNYSVPSHFVQPSVSREPLHQPFFTHHQTLSQPNFATETIQAQPVNDMNNGQFHDIPDFARTVPTILETTQPGSQECIIQNLAAAGYPDMNAPEAAAPYLAFEQPAHNPQFMNDQQFTFTSGLPDFSGPFGELPSGVNNAFDFQNFVAATSAPMQSIESTSSAASVPSTSTEVHSVNTAPSSIDNSPLPSLTSGFPPRPEDRKPSITLNGGVQTDVPADGSSSRSQTISESPEAMNNQWACPQQQNGQQYFTSPNFYKFNNSSQGMVAISQQQNNVKLDQGNQPELDMPNNLPPEAYLRRESSTTQLTQSLQEVDLQTPTNEPEFKQPNGAVGLAARRQRPRPAALNNAALRSASYSSGMPASPSHNPALTTADQTLRRIRSSVGVNAGRIQKSGCGSGQRSPMNFNFPQDAAASPKYARHPSFASPGLPVSSANSLAPPTPLTPSEFPRQFPPWQSHGTVKQYGKPENINSDASLLGWQHVGTSGAYPNVTSPPTTPLDAEVAMQAQAQAYAQHQGIRGHVRQQSLYRDTPPQSAPATQQNFPQNLFMPNYTMAENPNLNEQGPMADKVSHLRRPSLPDAANTFTMDSQIQWNVPEFDRSGELQMYPVQLKQGMNGLPQYDMQHMQRSTPMPPGTTAPGQASLVHPNFAVHEYSPPHGQTHRPSLSQSRDSAPKVYHFANQGPRDFEHSH